MSDFMERTRTSVQTALSDAFLVDKLIYALECLAEGFPVDRLYPDQIDRIETAARILRTRLEELSVVKERRSGIKRRVYSITYRELEAKPGMESTNTRYRRTTR